MLHALTNPLYLPFQVLTKNTNIFFDLLIENFKNLARVIYRWKGLENTFPMIYEIATQENQIHLKSFNDLLKCRSKRHCILEKRFIRAKIASFGKELPMMLAA
jgi:hypothetical protein